MGILQQIVNGIVTGSIYVLVGMGLSQIYGVLEISHFAHGSVVMVGGYICYTLSRLWGLPYIVALLAAVIISAGLGVLIERLTYRRAMKGPAINVFIVAIGLMFIFENICQTIWGPDQVAIQLSFNKSISFGAINVTTMRLVIVVVNILLMIGISVLLKYTKLGRSVRAVAQSREAAAMIGVNVNQTSTIVFALGSALAGLSGAFIASILSVYPTFGNDIVLKGFSVMILGGLGSVPGVILGGTIMGLVESLGATFISSTYKDAFGFIVIILVLLFRPNGLLGKKTAQ